MKNRPILFLATMTIASVGIACSGVESDLFNVTDGGGSDFGDSGKGDGGRTTRDGGKSDGGGGGGDGGIPQVDSGGPRPGIVPTVCGTSTHCSGSDPICCATQGASGLTPATYACTASPSECSSSSTAAVPILCRDDSDCTGGTVCCGELADPSAQGGYKSVSCESSCVAKDTGGNLTTHVPFCASTTTSASCSAYGLTCVASTILAGFIVCGGD